MSDPFRLRNPAIRGIIGGRGDWYEAGLGGFALVLFRSDSGAQGADTTSAPSGNNAVPKTEISVFLGFCYGCSTPST